MFRYTLSKKYLNLLICTLYKYILFSSSHYMQPPVLAFGKNSRFRTLCIYCDAFTVLMKASTHAEHWKQSARCCMAWFLK